MRIDLYIHQDASGDSQKLDTVITMLQTVIQKENQMAATIDDVIAAAAAEKAVDDSVVALLNQLTQLLQAAIATNDPAKVQAALDAINANKQELADAVTANTPAA